MTELALQLKRLSSSHAHTTSTRKTKFASLLFDGKDAESVDIETVWTLAVEGVKSLSRDTRDIRFDEFLSAPLFAHPQNNNQPREMMSPEDQSSVDGSVDSFLRILSPHFMLPASHRAIEFLIRRYRIHEFNVESILRWTLPYHQSNIFIRLVQLLNMRGVRRGPWDFIRTLPLDKITSDDMHNSIIRSLRDKHDIALLTFIGETVVEFFSHHNHKSDEEGGDDDDVDDEDVVQPMDPSSENISSSDGSNNEKKKKQLALYHHKALCSFYCNSVLHSLLSSITTTIMGTTLSQVQSHRQDTLSAILPFISAGLRSPSPDFLRSTLALVSAIGSRPPHISQSLLSPIVSSLLKRILSTATTGAAGHDDETSDMLLCLISLHQSHSIDHFSSVPTHLYTQIVVDSVIDSLKEQIGSGIYTRNIISKLLDSLISQSLSSSSSGDDDGEGGVGAGASVSGVDCIRRCSKILGIVTNNDMSYHSENIIHSIACHLQNNVSSHDRKSIASSGGGIWGEISQMMLDVIDRRSPSSLDSAIKSSQSKSPKGTDSLLSICFSGTRHHPLPSSSSAAGFRSRPESHGSSSSSTAAAAAATTTTTSLILSLHHPSPSIRLSSLGSLSSLIHTHSLSPNILSEMAGVILNMIHQTVSGKQHGTLSDDGNDEKIILKILSDENIYKILPLLQQQQHGISDSDPHELLQASLVGILYSPRFGLVLQHTMPPLQIIKPPNGTHTHKQEGM